MIIVLMEEDSDMRWIITYNEKENYYGIPGTHYFFRGAFDIIINQSGFKYI
jgi:hypothetical protein